MKKYGRFILSDAVDDMDLCLLGMCVNICI